MLPAISIITAAFNAEATIADCIQSIIDQEFQNWELIVVDDASTDGTLSLARAFADKDTRIRVISLPSNRGSGFCRNLAIESARAPLLAVADADDRSKPGRLRLQYEFLQDNPSFTAVASQLEEFGDWGGPSTSSWPTSTLEIENRQRRNAMPLPHPSCMLRTDRVREVGGYDVHCKRSQDYALFLKLRRDRLACLNTVLVSYRTQRPLSIKYAIWSGRFASLARKRVLKGACDIRPARFPQSTLADARSIAQWGRRRMNERGISDTETVKLTAGAVSRYR
ncbi:glycosyltransferase family 2 protein [Rhodococcoides corynebacterioides]|uniref:glycosyltransferase family 2 protein n=1 Tax=Rhodococcoides corynebacterioides TaxID=53972 RepID=UPI00093527C2